MKSRKRGSESGRGAAVSIREYGDEKAKPKPVDKEVLDSFKIYSFSGESLMIRNFRDVLRDLCSVTASD